MRLVVVYILLATTTLFFLKFSSTSQKPHHHRHRHRHLGPRQGNGHAAFDPLAGQFKGILTQGKSYSQIDDEQLNSFPDTLDDPKEYFSEEGLLNITGRLQVLFPLLDRSPEDGVLSFEELEAWNARQAINRLIFWSNKTLKEHDKDGDEAISFSEYLNHVSEETTDESMDRPDEWLKERFLIADVDGNGHLNLTEFNDLLHPEESDNQHIQLWLIKEKIREMDDDKDGKLNFNEFRNKAYTTYEKYFEFASGNNDIPGTEEKFAELDLNKDRLLTADELRAFFRRFHSGELSYAKRYTRHLITEVDQDRDGKLTLDEMLARPHVFYSTVLTGGEFENDDDNFHDEL